MLEKMTIMRGKTGRGKSVNLYLVSKPPVKFVEFDK